ncbi:Leo1-like protein [Babesia duncani]|uniref:Leo1-like protein n=1 Tax=Babesia duncani TaxID=323732 RepID=A0AAD9PNH0_9APIC|nr:Leo1-like protein [Babesia duncani]
MSDDDYDNFSRLNSRDSFTRAHASLEKSLFVDSDDSELDLDEAKSGDETSDRNSFVEAETPVQATISVQLLASALPDNDNIVTCKLPPAVSIATAPFNEEKEREFLRNNPQLLEKPISEADFTMIRWIVHNRYGWNYDEENFDAMETNSHIVQWDDGTYTLFVGKTPLDCDPKMETVFLIEDSLPNIKPVHAMVNGRLQTKFSNLFKNESVRKKYSGVNRQKMALTTISEAESSEMYVQKVGTRGAFYNL